MSDFSGKQTDIIDCFFRTGKTNNQQRAVILPVLVSWIFKEKPELKNKLSSCYGPLPEDVMQGLGSDLLDKKTEAENLLEEMLSKVRKEN
jgi:hypothetical protein